MSHTWKLLPLAAVFALGLIMVLPGSLSHPTRPESAAAACATTTGSLNVNIRDANNADSRIPVGGSVVVITPKPSTGSGTTAVVDDSGSDESSTHGLIHVTNVCGDNSYTAQLDSVPSPYSNCDVLTDSASGQLTGAGTVTLNLEIDCGGANLTPTTTVTTTTTTTPTPTVTGTVGPASGVTLSASPTSLGCNGTSIITVQVKDASGNPVAAGTAVALNTTKGTLSPSNGTTASDGTLFVFLSAPSNAGGPADITATAGSASGKVTVTINCNVAPTNTTAPPPTVSTGGTISPPNTGDAGLSDNGTSWQTYGGIALVVASVLGALVLVRSRVRD
jgi:hypothetical protein